MMLLEHEHPYDEPANRIHPGTNCTRGTTRRLLSELMRHAAERIDLPHGYRVRFEPEGNARVSRRNARVVIVNLLAFVYSLPRWHGCGWSRVNAPRSRCCWCGNRDDRSVGLHHFRARSVSRRRVTSRPRRAMVAGPAAIACALFTLLASVGCGERPPARLTLATTTSVGNSGLLEPLALAFFRQHRIELRSHLAGSGRALELLANGNADVVISHAPGLEADALRRHPEWRYQKIMFNDFVLVAPRHDPAQVRNARDIGEAMRRIASSPTARFLSRGDRSGTHEREEALWAAAGQRPSPDRLVIGGAGMGATLRMASETGAYTLTDRATFTQIASRLSLAVVVEGGELLLNTYAVIVPSSGSLQAQATAFADWLSEGKGRDVIDLFRIGSDLRAFSVWPLESPRHHPGAVPHQLE